MSVALAAMTICIGLLYWGCRELELELLELELYDEELLELELELYELELELLELELKELELELIELELLEELEAIVCPPSSQEICKQCRWEAW